ncbi:hypothetical protein MMH89_01015 [Candidatus Comchoanobacter bicostacola]|uniref:Uncharacterized protein n=1 Tax=Candidatus Comchoanobacter bicostacola TaxID=2919598 RepID=A0ABY5DJN7_9GAMM|nr:hypothetical protein [Candidatus Comchoanobacter bicostacola]UTC24736.1 hypothetical protein MMH89_01015 [Candidatus Comchoanobacter bicostacola]
MPTSNIEALRENFYIAVKDNNIHEVGRMLSVDPTLALSKVECDDFPNETVLELNLLQLAIN